MNRLDLFERVSEIPPEDQHAAIVNSGSITILDLLDNAPWFNNDNASSWRAWRAFLAAAFALPMSPEELAIYKKHTGRLRAPEKPARELWLVCGRRSRKSAIAALLGVYIGAFRDHSKYLAPGERAQIPIVAKNMEEATQIRDYAAALLHSHEVLRALLEKEPTSLDIRLITRCDLKIRAATHMAGRSKSVPCFLGDEIAFYPTKNSAHPDAEILAGVRGAMAMVPNPLTVGLSSPHARKGVLWEKYKNHYGREGDVLVWQADTRDMNDSPVIREWANDFFRDDPAKAKAEVGGQFRDDVASLMPEELVERCTLDLEKRDPQKGVQYVGFVDPAGGGGTDDFTLAIAHFDLMEQRAVLDLLVGWSPPFNFEDVVKEAAGHLSRYNCRGVTGDRFAGDIPPQSFRRNGIQFYVSERNRSEIYRALLPILNSDGAWLLRSAALKAQLTALERTISIRGQEFIDHPPDDHDDYANSAAAVIVLADRFRRPMEEQERTYESTQEIVNARMWSAAKPEEGVVKNPFARKGGW